MRASPLSLWALCAACALWTPAFAVPGLPLPLQPLDLIALAGWPLLTLYCRRMTGLRLAAPLGLAACVLTSWSMVGGQPLVALWTVACALPFTALSAIALADITAREAFLRGFLMAATASALLFLAQIVIGAQALDFRTNIAFSLPPHYGRGFALFPEVSTFATHITMTIGVLLALLLHPGTRRRAALWAALFLFAGCLLFTRSTSVIVLAPLLVGVALQTTQTLSLRSLLIVMASSAVIAIVLTFFVSVFYADRLATNAADRSAAMRLASMLGGLSPLWSGELFGVGIGENHEVRLRAHQMARALGLNFGTLPTGVNSQIIGRIFEEGWPALLQMAVMVRAMFSRRTRHAARLSPATAALLTLGIGSLLTALLVTGYRGIYTNWLWIAVAAALAPRQTRSERHAPCPA
ncbi:hypothetical protein [Cognatishimia sp. MH4019]|uniref:hypothetical protein n=1 Tax=Cognatishimia sp. MH4019 TaxID=2854030 RepID=UPI001CD2C608|nr:hypothetical protein [Cognatishimia sp. MH4019]